MFVSVSEGFSAFQIYYFVLLFTDIVALQVSLLSSKVVWHSLNTTYFEGVLVTVLHFRYNSSVDYGYYSYITKGRHSGNVRSMYLNHLI